MWRVENVCLIRATGSIFKLSTTLIHCQELYWNYNCIFNFLQQNHKINRQRWQATDMPAELAKKSSAYVDTRYVSSEILWGSKEKNFLGHFWLGIFIQDNLPVNLKQEV